MSTIRIYRNDELESEIQHSPRMEKDVKTDCEMAIQNGENVRYEIYSPPPPLEEQKAQLITQIKAEASRRIYETAPPHKQVNAALGLEPAEVVEQIKATIDAHRAVVELAEGAFQNASTQEQIDNIVVVWP